MFLFEILYRGVVKMYTEDKSCVYSKGNLLKMQEAGYEFRLNGKPYQPQMCYFLE